jgi:hypothetical protein
MLRVDRFDDVPRVAHVYETNGAGSIEAYWPYVNIVRVVTVT